MQTIAMIFDHSTTMTYASALAIGKAKHALQGYGMANKVVAQQNRTQAPKGIDPAPRISPAPARPRRTQAERSQATREQILKIAVQLLREKGIGGLRTSEVAELAGVSQGAQFHHFKTKEELIVAALEFVESKSLDTSRRRATTLKAGEEPIALIMKDARDYYFSEHFLVELSVGLTRESDSRMIAAIRKRTRETRLTVERTWLEVLIDTGIPREKAADLLALTLSVVRGIAVRQLIVPSATQTKRLFATWQGILREHLATIGPA